MRRTSAGLEVDGAVTACLEDSDEAAAGEALAPFSAETNTAADNVRVISLSTPSTASLLVLML